MLKFPIGWAKVAEEDKHISKSKREGKISDFLIEVG